MSVICIHNKTCLLSTYITKHVHYLHPYQNMSIIYIHNKTCPLSTSIAKHVKLSVFLAKVLISKRKKDLFLFLIQYCKTRNYWRRFIWWIKKFTKCKKYRAHPLSSNNIAELNLWQIGNIFKSAKYNSHQHFLFYSISYHAYVIWM